jgi:hypothetical protein
MYVVENFYSIIQSNAHGYGNEDSKAWTYTWNPGEVRAGLIPVL